MNKMPRIADFVERGAIALSLVSFGWLLAKTLWEFGDPADPTTWSLGGVAVVFFAAALAVTVGRWHWFGLGGLLLASLIILLAWRHVGEKMGGVAPLVWCLAALVALGWLLLRRSALSGKRPQLLLGLALLGAGLGVIQIGGLFQMDRQTQNDIGLKLEETPLEKPVVLANSAGQLVPLDQPGVLYLVDFWALGCHPCMMEMPDLNQLRNDRADDRLQIISVISGWSSKDHPYVRKRGKTGDLPLYSDPQNWEGHFRIHGYPTKLLIRDGKVIAPHVGAGTRSYRFWRRVLEGQFGIPFR